MLARLQQFITLGLLALGFTWVGVCLVRDEPEWALPGLVVLSTGHATVLGIELLLQAWINRHDPSPPASWRLRLRAWWGESHAAPRVFCWRQPFRSRRWPDHLPDDAQGRRGLLLVHGFVCNRGLWNAWYPDLRARGVPHLAVDLEPVFGSIDDYVAVIEQAVRRLETATGLPPVVVAHSMGGLAVRRWWAEPGHEARLHRVLTLGSPHHGTWLARWAFSINGRQMRMHSPWLRTLAARESPARHARMTCFYTHCDNIVFPTSSATLPGADNRHVEGVAHVHLADHPAPRAEALRWLGVAQT